MGFLHNPFAGVSPSFAQSLLYTVLFIIVGGYISFQYTIHRDVPGPFLAKFTNLWRFFTVRTRSSHETYLKLHKKHGDLVRIGPNCISVSKPDLISTIYGVGKGYVKSDFYSVWQNIVNGQRVASMVFTTDEEQHAAIRRPVASAYSLSTLKDFEPLIDSTTAVFLSRLDELYADTGKVCDLGTWLQWYAFDVTGELTFFKRLGFLEKAQDIEGIAASIAKNFDRCSVLGQMPWLDLLTYKNPIYLTFFAKSAVNPIITFAQRRLVERTEGTEDHSQPDLNIPDPALREKVLHNTLPSKPDFLSRFLDAHTSKSEETITHPRLLAYLFMNINAGSDTIASTLRALFYHLLKNPSTLTTLTSELLTARENNTLSSPLPTYAETQPAHLPYLHAVLKESLRLNPALSLPLERIVPPGKGLEINDHHFQPGTVLGINPWVLHRDPRIFGSDADIWRPERWLDDDKERVKYMEHHLLAFGAGSRTCLGRNIAMLELCKVVPALVLRFEIGLERPEGEWRVVNSWAVRQEGLNVVIRKRKEG